jgi:site-specific DNA-methyltransferase (adenine-specific)
MGAAMVQVGFEIKKLEAWVYGSGFPKSLDVSKALDKSVGAKRQILATRKGRVSSGTGCYNWNNPNSTGDQSQVPITDPVTEAAKKFNGYGTTLKPAWEPFLVGRKPC